MSSFQDAGKANWLALTGGAILLTVLTVLLWWAVAQSTQENVPLGLPNGGPDHAPVDEITPLSTDEGVLSSPEPGPDEQRESELLIQPSGSQAEKFPQGLDVLARSVRRTRANTEKMRNVATAFKLIKRAIYLREDILGRSYSLDRPLPPEVHKNDFWIAVNGMNGPRVYQFGNDEYPLYWKLAELEGGGEQSRAATLDPGLLEEVFAFADESLAMYGGDKDQ